MGQLQEIPGVGKKTEQDLIQLGYTTIDSLQGVNPEELYEQECIRKGTLVDRCVLYVFRCAVYYANTPPEQQDPYLLKWWNWKDNQ